MKKLLAVLFAVVALSMTATPVFAAMPRPGQPAQAPVSNHNLWYVITHHPRR